ncbi:putative membrane protein YqhA [Sulfuritortus calidifontis]|uniref:Putative membrane protein YqhA n=1 Tax=Sulfuritortus calidifontis TaxID=1914471 RepID=A0A4R3JW26_9PROT|nr:YqhA family protein [Sulfuritortus calidifontis]TCS72404.1 putative membrane protein YqhA [Sulfuritortus calidifontis]
MLQLFERFFEKTLWSGRFVVVVAVVASMAAATAIFYMATVDVVYLVGHMLHYADPSLTADARKAVHDETITHVVEVVDGYLLATFMLIFALGMYELFVSDIDEARGSKTSSKILVIESLDDLKARLAKVILMILIVTLFEEALKMHLDTTLDLLYLGGGIALVGLALYLTHKSESHGKEAEEAPPH